MNVPNPLSLHQARKAVTPARGLANPAPRPATGPVPSGIRPSTGHPLAEALGRSNVKRAADRDRALTVAAETLTRQVIRGDLDVPGLVELGQRRGLVITTLVREIAPVLANCDQTLTSGALDDSDAARLAAWTGRKAASMGVEGTGPEQSLVLAQALATAILDGYLVPAPEAPAEAVGETFDEAADEAALLAGARPAVRVNVPVSAGRDTSAGTAGITAA